MEGEKEKEKGVSQKEDMLTRLEKEVRIDENFDHKKWLEENIWGYYD